MRTRGSEREGWNNWTLTLMIHRMVAFLGAPFSLRNQPLYVRHCHRTVPRSCRFECFMFAGYEAVIHLEMCAVSE